MYVAVNVHAGHTLLGVVLSLLEGVIGWGVEPLIGDVSHRDPCRLSAVVWLSLCFIEAVFLIIGCIFFYSYIHVAFA